jgi:hypothetical protein
VSTPFYQDEMRLEGLDLVADVLRVLLFLKLHVGQRDVPVDKNKLRMLRRLPEKINTFIK